MSGAGGPMPYVPLIAGAGKPGPEALSLVVGQHEFDGWKVALMRLGMPAVLLTPEQANSLGEEMVAHPERVSALGAELIKMAAICEGKWGDD